MWHNPLAKSRSNLHQKPWEKQNYVSTIPSLENLNQESWEKTKLFLYPSTSSNMGGCTVDRCAHICAMAVWDEELLEKIFFSFCKKITMTTLDGELLELLLLKLCYFKLMSEVFLSTSKKIREVKKEFISNTVWHNSLGKSRSNLHQNLERETKSC
jgi:hypothetical protein